MLSKNGVQIRSITKLGGGSCGVLVIRNLSQSSTLPTTITKVVGIHSYDILGARMLWKPKEARILKNLKKIYRSTSVIW
jgi:hypothetical protein